MTLHERLEQACDLRGHVIDVRLIEDDADSRPEERSLQEIIDDGQDPVDLLPNYFGGPIEILQVHKKERSSREPELYPGIHFTTPERDRTAKYR